MKLEKFTLLIFFICLLSGSIFGQDTIRLERKPKIIIKSWYPEYKNFPKLKIGENKILFTIIKDFDNLSIRDNDIDLKTLNTEVKVIESPAKENQFEVKVGTTNAKYVEFELWFEIEDKTILIKNNKKWINVNQFYTFKNNRILIEKIKLELIK